MHNKQNLLTIGLTPLVTLFTLVTFSAPSKAATPTITCDINNNQPQVNAAFTQDGEVKNVTILSFVNKYFSGDDAVEKCQSAASELQAIYSEGNAKYLTADKLDTQPVVCAVERRGIGCSHHNAKVLFTLNEGHNPNQVLYDMLGSDFKQSLPPDARTVSRIYSDIKPRPWWKFF